MLENSLDASASKIEIHIINNGLDLININDNGHGIAINDLPYAFTRHATSKIDKFEDLYQLKSFGFRGEALASAASCSRLTCSSIPKENLALAGKIIIHGAKQVFHGKIKGDKAGTSLYIKDLFYNTPARLKFIKSSIAEKKALKRIINAFILSNPLCEFYVKWDEQEKDIYPIANTPELKRKRVFKILSGRKKLGAIDFINISKEYEGHNITGTISKSSSRGQSGKATYLFTNGRLFTDRPLHQFIIRAMAFLWAPGEVGHYFVEIKVPSHLIDVNVHPSKSTIKFEKFEIVSSLIKAAIKESLEHCDFPGPKTETKSNVFLHQQLPSSYNEELANGHLAPFISLNQNDLHDNSLVLSPTKDLLIYLDLNFWLYSPNNIQHREYFSLNTEILLRHFLISNIEKYFPIEENDATPLLISEPFNNIPIIFDTAINFFKQLGFEFDRLNQQLVVLRTIPGFITDLDYKTITQLLISIALEAKERTTLSKSNIINLLLNYSDRGQNTILKHEDEIKKLLSDFSPHYLLQHNIMIPLNSYTLSKFKNV